MSKPDTWMPLYIGDYIAATTHLSTTEHGAYLLLLMTAWNRGGKLPANDAQLAQICRCDKKTWPTVRGAVMPFFEQEEGFIFQRRLIEEYEKALRLNAKQKANGLKGGRPKKTQDGTQPAILGTGLGSELTNPDVAQDKPVGFGWDTPNHNPNESPIPSPSPINSDPYGSGGAPPGTLSPSEIIFAYGVPLLTSTGTPEKQARSFLGGLRKQHGDDAVIAKLRECSQAQPLQPIEWLAKALPPPGAVVANGNSAGRSKSGPPQFQVADAADYTKNLAEVVDSNGNLI